jgi:uncharacterized protein (TIGR00369 family)
MKRRFSRRTQLLAAKIHKTDMYTGITCGKKVVGAGGSVVVKPSRDKILAMPRKIHGHETRHLKPKKNYCFVCGPDNPEGMRLKFTLDEARQTFVCRFRLPKRYTGPPGHCHGGVIACILDDAMGKANKLRNVVALTKEMTVEYLKPVPLLKPLVVEGREVSVHGRQHINMAEILNEKGEVLARSKGVFIAIDPEKMFGKFAER